MYSLYGIRISCYHFHLYRSVMSIISDNKVLSFIVVYILVYIFGCFSKNDYYYALPPYICRLKKQTMHTGSPKSFATLQLCRLQCSQLCSSGAVLFCPMP